MTNLGHDMNHCHTMDAHGKKQFSTNAVTTVRRSHHTSGSFRGQQLLSTVQGKRLEVTSLCKLHDEENGDIPDGSVRALRRSCPFSCFQEATNIAVVQRPPSLVTHTYCIPALHHDQVVYTG